MPIPKDLEAIEEVDTRGEEDGDGVEYLSRKDQILFEIRKIGQPWLRGVNILKSGASDEVRQNGKDARRLEELREELKTL